MAYTGSRGTSKSEEPIRFSPLSPTEIKEREGKGGWKLRKKDAQHWKKATDEFIDNVIIYREKGGTDTILNDKIKAYLESLGVDYNKYVLQQNGKRMGWRWWRTKADKTQRTQQMTFFDLIREKEAEQQRDRWDKRNADREVCFLSISRCSMSFEPYINT